MPDNALISVNLPDEAIRGAVAARVQTAMIDALGHDEDAAQIIIGKLVDAVLHQKVGADGQVSRYSSDNKFTFVEALCRQAICTAAREAIAAWVTSNTAKISAAIETQLNRRTKGMTKAFVDGLVDSVKSDWRLTVNVGLSEPSD